MPALHGKRGRRTVGFHWRCNLSALRSTPLVHPNCGRSTTIRFDAQQSQERKDHVLEIIANQLGVDRDKIANNSAMFDVDVVELVMTLEEEFDLP
jgi:hypothetical protein